MRSVDEQLERVLGAAVRPAPVRLAITEAYGLRCAEEVVSPRPVPGFDMAAIDGYAVRSVDVFGAGEVVPVELPVVGEIPAGSRHPLRRSPAVRSPRSIWEEGDGSRLGRTRFNVATPRGDREVRYRLHELPS